jgi:hypothetical protein
MEGGAKRSMHASPNFDKGKAIYYAGVLGLSVT